MTNNYPDSPTISKTAPLLFVSALLFSLLFNGLNLIWFSIAMVLLVILFLVQLFRIYDHGANIHFPWLTLVMVMFWLWLGIDILFSPVTYLSTINFWWVGTLPFVYLIYTFLPDKDAFWQLTLKLLIATGIGLSMLAIHQYFFVDGEPVGTFFNRNSLAVFLNFLIFPLIVIYLISTRRWQMLLALLVILLFAYTIGIIKSRGAGLGFILGFILLLQFGLRHISLKRWTGLLAAIILAIGLATMSAKLNPLTIDISLIERVASIHEVDKAGYDRFVIWQPAWQLFLENPLTGIGLGSYYLAIKPYLHLRDFSAPQYVHNDYLQIALETGIPGFIFFASIFILAALLFSRAIRHSKNNVQQRLQILAVSASLLAVSFHSFFTFIIYTMPLTMLMGLYFARLNHLAEQILHTPVNRTLKPALLRPRFYKAVISISGLIVLFYFISLGISTFYSNKGAILTDRVMLREAHESYVLAQLFAPKVDTAFYKDADLLQKTARAITDNPEVRRQLLEQAEATALQASQLNPLRSETRYILAQIYLQTSPDDIKPAIREYVAALKINPRHIAARYELAELLYNNGRIQEAYDVIRLGFPFVYTQLTPAFLGYLAVGISASQAIGDSELAKHLQERREHYRAMLKKSVPAGH